MNVTSLKACLVCFIFSLSTAYSAYAADHKFWHRVQSNFKLTHAQVRAEIKPYQRYYCQHAYQIEKTLSQNTALFSYIFEQTQQAHMPSEIAFIPYIESHFNHKAHSRTGALGLWQMMPGTASGFGLRINWWVDQRMDLHTSTQSALSYLHYLYNYFNHDWLLAIAAYDAGEGTVKKAIRRNRQSHKPTDFWSLSLPKETKAYIPKLLGLAEVIKNPQQCKLRLPHSNTELTAIEVPQQSTFEEIAQLTKISVQHLATYNPHFLHRITERHQPKQTLILPKTYANRLKGHLTSPKAIHWRHHEVKANETLSQIAQYYHTSTELIQKSNHLHNATIKKGDDLIIAANANHLSQLPTIPKIINHSFHGKGPKQLIYTIQKGDTLSSIAAPYPVNPAMIRYWNPKTSRSPLKPNQNLVIWLPRINHYDHYVVAEGDTLGHIAQRFGVTIKAIQSINSIRNPHTIKPGSTLKIPIAESNQATHLIHYTVRKGDALSSIAHHHHITLSQLMDWNELQPDSMIHPGQQLIIFR